MSLAKVTASAALMVACSLPSLQQPTAPTPISQHPSISEISVTLEALGCSDSELELVVPFYEGIALRSPQRTLVGLGTEQIELTYPSPLSLPAVAWRCRGQAWSAIGATLDDAPVVLRLRKVGERHTLALSCLGSCQLRGWNTAGELDALARSFAAVFDRKSDEPALSARYREIDFFVHQWVSDVDPALRTDFPLAELSEQIRATPETTLAFVYGWDPAGVDLGGRYFWSEGAEQHVVDLVRDAPNVHHMAWLNLRTFKYAIPRLGLRDPLPAEIQKAAWKGPEGKNVVAQYAFEAVEMCLCSSAWQRSRRAELEHLASLGFDVIQLDEFPVATRWHAAGCVATDHQHPAGNPSAEWACTLAFVRELAKRAGELGVALTSEEPSGALLGSTIGYIDRQPSSESDMYAFWTRSPNVRKVPLFSSAFGTRVTAYTDADATGETPSNWLRMRKRTRSE